MQRPQFPSPPRFHPPPGDVTADTESRLTATRAPPKNDRAESGHGFQWFFLCKFESKLNEIRRSAFSCMRRLAPTPPASRVAATIVSSLSTPKRQERSGSCDAECSTTARFLLFLLRRVQANRPDASTAVTRRVARDTYPLITFPTNKPALATHTPPSGAPPGPRPI